MSVPSGTQIVHELLVVCGISVSTALCLVFFRLVRTLFRFVREGEKDAMRADGDGDDDSSNDEEEEEGDQESGASSEVTPSVCFRNAS